MECPGQVARWKTELGESWASPETPGTQPVLDTISTHRRGRDPLLTAVVLSPQVVGFRDVLHQAHPPAWHYHCHRQLLHLPDQQEEGRCCTRHLWAWQAVGAGVTLLLSGPEVRCLPPSSLCLPSLFHLRSFGRRGLKQRLGLGAGKVVLMSVSAPALGQPPSRQSGGWGGVVTALDRRKSLSGLESWQSSEKQSDLLPFLLLLIWFFI